MEGGAIMLSHKLIAVSLKSQIAEILTNKGWEEKLE